MQNHSDHDIRGDVMNQATLFLRTRIAICLIWAVIVQIPFMPVSAHSENGPCPNPPEWQYPEVENKPPDFRKPLQIKPETEWTYHKTSDGSHPDGNEQQMMWFMNRARTDPFAEGIWLANLDTPDVVSAISNLNIDLETMKAEFAAIPPKPPAAFDVRLYNAAYQHCLYLISCNCQSHNGQDTRVENEGFEFSTLRGNVFSYTNSGIHCHAALNIDWGASSDGTGMQDGRGHRVAIMSIDRRYYNAGIAIVPHNSSYPDVGPLVMTGNYATAKDFGYVIPPDHYNRFIVGTVWKDNNLNGLYDPGEGIGNVSVTPDHGTYYAVTGSSGGYSIPITEKGIYPVTFAGPSLPQNGIVKQVSVEDDSVLLDLNTLAPVAVFDAAPKSGNQPLDVKFTDQSQGNATTWKWNFGDGKTSSIQHPAHTYTQAGQYTVTLTISSSCGTDTLVRTDFITVTEPLAADFSASVTKGLAPMTILFTDQSSGPVTEWVWSFGDTGSSILKNPSHTFTHEGFYTITLTVTDSYGSDVRTRPNYIFVASPAADINGDTHVDLEDIIIPLKTITGKSMSVQIRTDILPDINGNDKVGSEEAIYNLRLISP